MMPVLNTQIRGKTTKVVASNHLQNKGTCTVTSDPYPHFMWRVITPDTLGSRALHHLGSSSFFTFPFPFLLAILYSFSSLLHSFLFCFVLLTPFLHIFLDLFPLFLFIFNSFTFFLILFAFGFF